METALNDRLIPITDDRARVLVPGDEYEPAPGSIVLTQGNWGTAWQRFFDDGLWYPASRGAHARGIPWDRMLLNRNLILVYDAPERV